MEYSKDALIELVRSRALQTGQFTLASGKTATFYLDCRKVTLDPQGAVVIGLGILERIAAMAKQPAAVGGMAIGADPITASVVTLAGLRGLGLRGFMVRKEAKEHGTGRQVEGPVQPGEDVVIVEDVITSGGSAIKAAEAAKAYGLNVLRVIAIVDRLAGGAERFEQAGLPLETLLTIRDLGIET